MTTKKQFLDPVGAGCRFVLLKTSEPNAKLRITDHTVQLVNDTIIEKLIYRPWVYGDSREDIAALYPVIVRFIELYLMEKRKIANPSPQIQQPPVQTIQPPKIKNTKQKYDMFEMNDDDDNASFSLGNLDCEEDDEYTDYGTAEKLNTVAQTSVQPQMTSFSKSTDGDEYMDAFDALKIIAQYMIEGMEELQKTYEYGNAVFALQNYITMLKAGIQGTYTREEFLPKHLRDFTSQNFLDTDKIKNLWKDKDIVELAGLLKLCFSGEKKTPSAAKAYRVAIESMLDDRDNIFKQMISSTNAS